MNQSTLGAVRRAAGGFKSGEQWEVVGRPNSSELVVGRAGQQRVLFLLHASKFSVFKAESISLSVGDRVRKTKNFQSRGEEISQQRAANRDRVGEAMHLFTDSKIALREAVTRPSSRLSPLELIADQPAIDRLQNAFQELGVEVTKRERVGD